MDLQRCVDRLAGSCWMLTCRYFLSHSDSSQERRYLPNDPAPFLGDKLLPIWRDLLCCSPFYCVDRVHSPCQVLRFFHSSIGYWIGVSLLSVLDFLEDHDAAFHPHHETPLSFTVSVLCRPVDVDPTEVNPKARQMQDTRFISDFLGAIVNRNGDAAHIKKRFLTLPPDGRICRIDQDPISLCATTHEEPLTYTNVLLLSNVDILSGYRCWNLTRLWKWVDWLNSMQRLKKWAALKRKLVDKNTFSSNQDNGSKIDADLAQFGDWLRRLWYPCNLMLDVILLHPTLKHEISQSKRMMEKNVSLAKCSMCRLYSLHLND